MTERLIDLSGLRFGRWTVVGRTPRETGAHGSSRWECRCDCGASGTIRSADLRRGQSQSCGCLKSERHRERIRTHGMTGSTEFTTWTRMRQRCQDANDRAFHHYGGRGIYVCDRWRSFATFYADMGPRPAGTSIDRIDNDGPYSPENCRWAGRTTQSLNRRGAKFLTLNGVTRPLIEWAELLNIPRWRIYGRLSKGASDAEALRLT